MARSITIAVVIALGLLGAGAQAASANGVACTGGQISTGAGCKSAADVSRDVHTIVRDSIQANGLRAVLARVDVDGRKVAALSPGNSMTGTPATLKMHFRTGSMAIPYLIDLLLQLQDEGRLSLDDPISKWYPELPNSGTVTLRMLASATSGYPDWIQGNPPFQAALVANPFRQWTTQELLDNAFAQKPVCDPGACFHYAHTGFVILGRLIRDEMGESLGKLIRTRIFRPLGLHDTDISALPAMPDPALHAYVNFRGPYEDSTYWSASWGISKNLLMTSTIGDVIRSAEALGKGELVSRSAARQRIAPLTIGLSPKFTGPGLYYGLGVDVANGWLIQNPVLNGWDSIMAVLPSRDISIALSVTENEAAASSATNFSETLLKQLTEYFTPEAPAVLPDA